MDKDELLRGVDIFASLSDEQLGRVAPLLQERRLGAGSLLCGPGLPAEGLFIVAAGEVRLAGVDPGGRESTLGLYGPGQYFGEMSLLGTEEAPGRATVVSEVLLLILRKEDFDAFLAQDLAATKEMMKVLALRQAAANLRLARGPQPEEEARGQVITVFSPKGGVGKSALAVNLATALARRYPDEVALLDLSLTFSHTPLLLGRRPMTSLSTVAARAPKGVPEPAAVSAALTRHPFALRVMAGAQTPEEGEMVSPEAAQAAIAALRQRFSFVVLDTASSLGAATLAALEAADALLVVVSPEVTTLHDARECQRLFQDALNLPPDRVHFILNSVAPHQALTRAQVEKALGQRLWAEIPYGRDQFARAAQAREPLVLMNPRSPVTQAIERLSRKLEPEKAAPAAVGAKTRTKRIGIAAASLAAVFAVIWGLLNLGPPRPPPVAVAPPAEAGMDTTSFAKQVRGIAAEGGVYYTLTPEDFRADAILAALTTSELMELASFVQGLAAAGGEPRTTDQIAQGMKSLPILGKMPPGKMARVAAYIATMGLSKLVNLMAGLRGLLARAGLPLLNNQLRQDPRAPPAVKKLPLGALTQVAVVVQDLPIGLGGPSIEDIAGMLGGQPALSNLSPAEIIDISAYLSDKRASGSVPLSPERVGEGLKANPCTASLNGPQLAELGDVVEEVRGRPGDPTAGEITALIQDKPALAGLPPEQQACLGAYVRGQPFSTPGCTSVPKVTQDLQRRPLLADLSTPQKADLAVYVQDRCAAGAPPPTLGEAAADLRGQPTLGNLSGPQVAEVVDYLGGRPPAVEVAVLPPVPEVPSPEAARLPQTGFPAPGAGAGLVGLAALLAGLALRRLSRDDTAQPIGLAYSQVAQDHLVTHSLSLSPAGWDIVEGWCRDLSQRERRLR